MTHSCPTLRSADLRACGLAGWESKIGRGAAIGGAGGAAVGAVVPGLRTVEGAALGAAGGAVVGALDKDDEGRQWYRDEYGNRYYIDQDGRRHYDCATLRTPAEDAPQSDEHTSELQALMRNPYAVFCLKQ